MSRITAPMLLMAGLLFLGACSQLPQAATYPMSLQHKMQAAEHWQVLASDVADQVQKAVDDRPDLQMRPIHIQQPDGKAFSRAFHDLLTSELVSRGMQVSVEQVDTIVLSYGVQTVTHSSRNQRLPPGLLTMLGAGVAVVRHLDRVPGGYTNVAIAGGALLADIMMGFWATESDSEVLVTTSLTEANRYVMRDTSIYYINDPDIGHYAGAGEVETVPVRIVND